MNLTPVCALATITTAVFLSSCVPYDEGLHGNRHQGNRVAPNRMNPGVQQRNLDRPTQEQVAKNEADRKRDQERARQRAKERERERQRERDREIANRGNDSNISERPKPPTPPKTTPKSYPTAAPVPGKPGYVYSPYNNKVLNVEGIPSGTLVQDTYYPASEKKHFRVP